MKAISYLDRPLDIHSRISNSPPSQREREFRRGEGTTKRPRPPALLLGVLPGIARLERLAVGEAPVGLVPVFDAILAADPAEVDFPPVAQVGEVHQALGDVAD